jgi:hypothetical protein
MDLSTPPTEKYRRRKTKKTREGAQNGIDNYNQLRRPKISMKNYPKKQNMLAS